MTKKGNLLLGICIGTIAPIIGMIGYYYLRVYPNSIDSFFSYLCIEKQFLSAVTSFALVMNALFFTIFINKKHDRTAIGIFLLTCIYGIFILVLHFF